MSAVRHHSDQLTMLGFALPRKVEIKYPPPAMSLSSMAATINPDVSIYDDPPEPHFALLGASIGRCRRSNGYSDIPPQDRPYMLPQEAHTVKVEHEMGDSRRRTRCH
jgi:hypothetical protein